MKLEFCRQISKNTEISSVMNIRLVGAELFYAIRQAEEQIDRWRDGQTGATCLIFAFQHFFSDAPTNLDSSLPVPCN
jgi:hypothetical protein